jgi:leucyl aminopeptidase
MNISIIKSTTITNTHTAVLISQPEDKGWELLSDAEKMYASARKEAGDNSVTFNRYGMFVSVFFLKDKKDSNAQLETLRKEGSNFQKTLNDAKATDAVIVSDLSYNLVLAFAEGLILADYRFTKYFSKADDKISLLSKIEIVSENLQQTNLDELANLCKAVYIARDLINEPGSFLTATQLAKEISVMGQKAGFEVEVLHKKQIEALKMGGLLAVNQGSTEAPTFSVLEYKPAHAVNSKPYVLVGKGLVYDSGGLSLKPTSDSMDYMKCDMAGGATVAATIYAVALNKLPVHLIGLVPSTDNRIDANSYAPGDVLTMYDGTTVENLNSDAEGRLILADALAYAKKFSPELVINMATLTGAASVAIGNQGFVAMGNASAEIMARLKDSSMRVFERIAEFPFWDEYAELLKSDIADLKNIGGRYAGSITAGKFLEHFTDYPFVHFDIAGPAYIKTNDAYRKKGGTGICVRLLYDFFRNIEK